MFKIRLGGTNEFVSEINPHASHCYPPGEVKFVKGWAHPDASFGYKTLKEMKEAA